MERRSQLEHGLTEKSREMGLSWTSIGWLARYAFSTKKW
jgi:hypothetical protein